MRWGGGGERGGGEGAPHARVRCGQQRCSRSSGARNVQAAVRGALRGADGPLLRCIAARHWVARALLSHRGEPRSGAAAEGDPSEINQGGLRVRVGWASV